MHNLSHSAIKAIALRVSIVIILGGVGNYWLNYQILREQTLEELDKYIQERVEREDFYYSLAKKNMDFVENDFLDQYSHFIPNIEKKFDARFEISPNGSLREIDYQNTKITQVFLRKSVPLTYELKKTAIIGHELLNNLGPAWTTNFVNIWLYTDSGLTMSYTPSVPHSLHFLDPQFSFLDFESIAAGLPQNNLKGLSRWTGVFFDRTLKKWILSYNRPVYYQGKYILSFGIDLTLDELMRRTSTTAMKGSFNVLFDQDGRLISHYALLNKIKSSNGKWSIKNSQDPILLKIFDISKNPETITYDPDLKVFIAVRRIPGPNWWFAIVYPETNLHRFSQKSAIFMITLGLLSLMMELLIFSHVIRKFVATPIQKLIDATKEITLGNSQSRVALEANNEIGVLADSFNIMADKVMDRDKELKSQANSLTHQVEEQNRELDVQRANAFNASKMATLGEFAGRIAHEVNNPLATIVLSSESLLKYSDDKKTIHYLNKMKIASERISRIVRGMQSFAEQKPSAIWQPHSLKSIIDDTLILCENSMRENNIDFIVHHFKDLSVYGDKSELCQLLLNLIENAIDALKPVEPKLIEINVKVKKSLFYIAVEDSGKGIPLEIQDKIMNPFFTTKEIGEGIGLGLFIASGIAKTHNGEIYLDKKSGKTRFVIRLPVSAHAVL